MTTSTTAASEVLFTFFTNGDLYPTAPDRADVVDYGRAAEVTGIVAEILEGADTGGMRIGRRSPALAGWIDILLVDIQDPDDDPEQWRKSMAPVTSIRWADGNTDKSVTVSVDTGNSRPMDVIMTSAGFASAIGSPTSRLHI